jgi:cytochrome c553
MKRFVCVWVLALLSAVAVAAERPEWAFPEIDKVLPPVKNDGAPKQMPGSAMSFTQAQIDDPMNPPDWFPDEHPPMPQVVAHGNGKVRACMGCHLSSGMGHPESSSLPGINAAYLARQMADFKSGARKGATAMTVLAEAISDEDVKAASDYYGALKPIAWTKVVETDTVPKTYIGKGNMRLQHPDGGTEPLGNRVIEIPQDPARATSRDPHSGFVAYVPAGSIAKGEALAKTGGSGRTIPCAACHGPDLKGLGEIPGIAGRSAIYTVRQLYNMQTGVRAGALAAMMKPAVDKLDNDDMLAIAAYLASREP